MHAIKCMPIIMTRTNQFSFLISWNLLHFVATHHHAMHAVHAYPMQNA